MASVVRYKDKWRALIRTPQRSTSKTFETKREAQVWARSEEAKAGNEIVLAEPREVTQSRRGATTFGDILDCYEQQARRAVGSSRQCALVALRHGLGTKRVTELDAKTFIEYGRRRAKTVAPSTVGSDLTYAGTALRFAGVLLDVADDATRAATHLASARTILRHMALIGPSEKRERRPTEDELQRLRDYCLNSQMRLPMWPLILFAITTAMRLGEITRLRWEDLDAADRTIVIRDRKHPTKKQGNDGTIPLLRGPVQVLGETIDPLAVIYALGTRRTGRIFPYSGRSLTNAFAYTCEKTKIDDLHFHDLRHDAISHLFEDNYAIPEVALVSGHKDWKHLKRYTNINPTSLHRATDE